MHPDRSRLLFAVVAGTVTSVIVSVGGYLMLRYDQSEFGAAMFILVPFLAGFVSAAVARKARRIAACSIVGGIITLTALFFLGLEGYLCILMSLPILSVAISIGGIVGYFTIGRFMDKKTSVTTSAILMLCAAPFLIGAADSIEKPFRHSAEIETIETQIAIDAKPSVVWNSLMSISELKGDRPFLLTVGLPIPISCEMIGDGLNAQRICYFNQGTITQNVTKWVHAREARFAITDSTLPGREWLHLVDAGYQLTTSESGGTTLKRHSTHESRLFPRWYWRHFERWGVISEHEYVLENIKRIAEANKG